MATLKAMFKLYDGYSRTADVVERKTQKATDKILKASGATDKFNSKLAATGVSASKASSGLGGFISKVVTVAGLMKGVDITDNFTNTSARLKLINDGLQTQLELENKIYAAADRSRGSYSDMAASVGKMGLLAGDAFGSNDELIGFTELMQKSFRIGGSSQREQQAGMYQLTQAMAAGKLQGDEFRSIMDTAPMLADAIATYMGKSKGELKELSSQGLITADIIKMAMFSAGDEINEKFETLPMTFADVWNDIKNGASKAFRPIMQRINEMINTDTFKDFIDDLISGFSVVANIAGKALDAIGGIYNFISTNWDSLRPIIEGVAAAWLTYKGALLAVEAAQWLVNIATAANPVGTVIVLIAVLIGVLVTLWEKCEGFRKFWADLWADNMKNAAKAYNAMVPVFNGLLDAYDWIIDKMVQFDKAVRDIWIGIVKAIANGVKGLISNFDFLLKKLNDFIPLYNRIAGVAGLKKVEGSFTTTDVLSGIDSIVAKYEGAIMANGNAYAAGMESKKQNKRLDLIDMDKYNTVVDAMADKIENFTLSGWLKGLYDEAKDAITDNDPYNPMNIPTSHTSPVTVKGTGSGGKIPVDMSDEDLKYLRDIAEREYINKFSTATLAPNITVSFGDVHETADADAVAGRIKKILQEEIAMTAEGAY